MMIRNSKLIVGMVLALLFPAPFAKAQQTSMDDLKKEIQSLSQTIKEMQKDIEEIKTLLRGRNAPTPPPPQHVLLDLDNDPAQGERTAKLTLIEFSDYQ
jgi:protein-disulfide isomerase